MTGDAPHPDDMEKSLTGLVLAVAGGLLMFAAFLQAGPLAAAAAVTGGTALAGAAATLFLAHRASQSPSPIPTPPPGRAWAEAMSLEPHAHVQHEAEGVRRGEDGAPAVESWAGRVGRQASVTGGTNVDVLSRKPSR
jgi:hypothetical protein